MMSPSELWAEKTSTSNAYKEYSEFAGMMTWTVGMFNLAMKFAKVYADYCSAETPWKEEV